MTDATLAGASDTLPHAKNRLKAIAEASSWAMSDLETMHASKRLAWRISAAAVLLALLGWVMAAYLSARPAIPPVVVVADRITGDTQVAGPFDATAVPKLSVLDQHFTEAFIRACESYSFKMLQRDYDQCGRMSSPKVFARYSAQFAGDEGKQNKVGDKEEATVSTVSVRMSPSTQPGRRGEAIVTFDKRVHLSDGSPDVVTRFIGTCEFEYHPDAMAKPFDRLENPLGFICTDYRKDAELISPTASSAPATSHRNGGAA